MKLVVFNNMISTTSEVSGMDGRKNKTYLQMLSSRDVW